VDSRETSPQESSLFMKKVLVEYFLWLSPRVGALSDERCVIGRNK